MSAEDSGNKEEDGGDGKLSVIVAIGGGGDFGPVARLCFERGGIRQRKCQVLVNSVLVFLLIPAGTSSKSNAHIYPTLGILCII